MRRRLAAVGVALGAALAMARPAAAEDAKWAAIREAVTQSVRDECRLKADRAAQDLNTAQFGSSAARQLHWSHYVQCAGPGVWAVNTALDMIETGRLPVNDPRCPPIDKNDDWHQAPAEAQVANCMLLGRRRAP